MKNTVSWIDGRASDQIDIDDRGLAYGDGLFETITVEGGVPQFLTLHLQRLQNSCVRLDIALNAKILSHEIQQLLSSQRLMCQQRVILKVIITRQATGRGYQSVAGTQGRRILQLIPVGDSDHDRLAQGVQLRVCDSRLSINPLLAGMKHLCRLENVLARAEWSDKSIYEGVMLDTEGFITEGVMSNIFLVKNGVLVTPHLDRCGVTGIVRELIFKRLAPSLNIPVSLDRVLLEQLNDADEIFISNSLIGIVPVIAITAFTKPIGAVTKALQRAFSQEIEREAKMVKHA